MKPRAKTALLFLGTIVIVAGATASASRAAGDLAAGKAIFEAKCHRCHAALPYTGRVKNLAAFLANPKRANPKTAMTFPGLKNKKDIEDVIVYITNGR
jgi:cytochrome c2